REKTRCWPAWRPVPLKLNSVFEISLRGSISAPLNNAQSVPSFSRTYTMLESGPYSPMSPSHRAGGGFGGRGVLDAGLDGDLSTPAARSCAGIVELSRHNTANKMKLIFSAFPCRDLILESG